MYQLEVKAMGYRPVSTPVIWMVEDGTAELSVRLRANAVLLAPLEIIGYEPGPRATLENPEFRSASGFGYYITREDIEARNPSRVSDMLATLPGLTMETSGGGGHGSFYMGRALPTGGQLSRCRVQVWVDGMLASGEGMRVDDFVSPNDVHMIEVFKGLASIPPEFLSRDAKCGVIAIWTRREPPPQH